MVAMARQSRLPQTDAEHLPDLLNQRAVADGIADLSEPRGANV